jgi:hypothetical protein
MKTHLIILIALALWTVVLPAATVTGRSAKTSLAGTEELPIDDSGTDKKVTVANLLLTPQGAMTATSFNGLTIDTTTGTLDMTNGKTLAVTNSLTLAGTDSTTITFPGTSQTLVGLTSTQTLTNKTLTSPTLTAPVLGVATATSINKVALTAPATAATLTIADGKTLTASNTLTLVGTDSTTFTFPATSNTVFTSTLSTNNVDAANAVWAASSSLILEGSSADTSETTLTLVNPTADRTITIPDATGTIILSAAAIDAANGIWGGTGTLIWEGATANASETTLAGTDPTADRTITIPDATGTITVAQASTATALTADNQAVTPGSATRIQLSSNDATATNRTFTLSATGAITGQIYILIGPATNAAELADTGIQDLSATWTAGADDSLTLLFDGTNFIELARSAN